MARDLQAQSGLVAEEFPDLMYHRILDASSTLRIFTPPQLEPFLPTNFFAENEVGVAYLSSRATNDLKRDPLAGHISPNAESVYHDAAVPIIAGQLEHLMYLQKGSWRLNLESMLVALKSNGFPIEDADRNELIANLTTNHMTHLKGFDTRLRRAGVITSSDSFPRITRKSETYALQALVSVADAENIQAVVDIASVLLKGLRVDLADGYGPSLKGGVKNGSEQKDFNDFMEFWNAHLYQYNLRATTYRGEVVLRNLPKPRAAQPSLNEPIKETQRVPGPAFLPPSVKKEDTPLIDPLVGHPYLGFLDIKSYYKVRELVVSQPEVFGTELFLRLIVTARQLSGQGTVKIAQDLALGKVKTDDLQPKLAKTIGLMLMRRRGYLLNLSPEKLWEVFLVNLPELNRVLHDESGPQIRISADPDQKNLRLLAEQTTIQLQSELKPTLAGVIARLKEQGHRISSGMSKGSGGVVAQTAIWHAERLIDQVADMEQRSLARSDKGEP